MKQEECPFMNILLIGYGRMGRLIEQTAQSAGDTVVAAMDVDNIDALATLGRVADVVMDFSNPSTLPMVEAYVRRTGTPYLNGTTGYSGEQMERIRALGAYAPVLHSGNYSVGIAVFQQVLRQISPVLLPDFDVEITETHHNQKVDAPSGTALMLRDAVDGGHDYKTVYGRQGAVGKREAREIGMHSLRGGTVAGVHTVSFFGPDEEFTITHRATSRQIFVNGALHMARILKDKDKGVYDLQALLFGDTNNGKES
jgi:4-hydroxy-tetrahydrodipicolinate reductase